RPEPKTRDEPPPPERRAAELRASTAGGGVVDLVQRRARHQTTGSTETAYEVELDEPPQTDPAPAAVDTPAVTGAATGVVEGRRGPIIPSAFHPANPGGKLRRGGRPGGDAGAVPAGRPPGQGGPVGGPALLGGVWVRGERGGDAAPGGWPVGARGCVPRGPLAVVCGPVGRLCRAGVSAGGGESGRVVVGAGSLHADAVRGGCRRADGVGAAAPGDQV